MHLITHGKNILNLYHTPITEILLFTAENILFKFVKIKL